MFATLPTYFLCLEFFLEVVVSQRRSSTSSCLTTISYAEDGYKSITSPGYPTPFPKQTQCIWIIDAPKGRRIELKFIKFYLLGARTVKNNCFSQHVKILDTYTGVTDGPYCGNSLPPKLVSTGRRIKITLESNAVGLFQYYSGFKARYKATRQRSSIRFRGSSKKWEQYNVDGGDMIVTTTTRKTTLPTRNPNEVDANNNAAIDAINNAANKQNHDQNEEINRIKNAINTISTEPFTYKSKIPTVVYTRKHRYTKPTRYYPRPTSSRPRPGINRIVTISSTPNKKSSKEKLGSGIISGIVVGVTIFLLGFLLVGYKVLNRKRSRTSERSNSTSSTNRFKQEVANQHSKSSNKPIKARECTGHRKTHREDSNKPLGLPGAVVHSHTSHGSHRKDLKKHRSHRRQPDTARHKNRHRY